MEMFLAGASAAIFGTVTRHDYLEAPIKKETFEVKDSDGKNAFGKILRYQSASRRALSHAARAFLEVLG